MRLEKDFGSLEMLGGHGGYTMCGEVGPRVNFHHVVLVGLSGSGKSTIGPRLARRLDLLFVDTDRSVVARAGTSIDEIFAARGEVVFRAFETEAVRDAVAGPRSVIATGAGAPMATANRALLWDGNAVVWLDAPIDVLVARLGRSDRSGRERRPLLQDGGAAVRLPALLETRRPVYESAHVRVETGIARPDVVVTEILRRIDPVRARRSVPVRRSVSRQSERSGGQQAASNP